VAEHGGGVRRVDLVEFPHTLRSEDETEPRRQESTWWIWSDSPFTTTKSEDETEQSGGRRESITPVLPPMTSHP
jgi:hypothetical protein